MHIALVGPMTLSMLQPLFGEPIRSEGYAFPGTAELALRYSAAGHRVTCISTGTDIDSVLRYEGEGVELVVVPARGRGKGRAFTLFRRERMALRREIDAAGPDVIHAHWTYEFGLAARSARAPSLLTVHDWAPAVARYNRHPYWYFRWLMQVACLTRPGLLTAPSRYVAERVERIYRRRCEVVPNGIDLDAYAPGPPADHPRVLMLNVGFSHRKNVSTALEAWPTVLLAVPGAELLLAGPGFEHGGECEAWAKERGLTEGVRFLGALDPADVPVFLSSGSLFLHTSLEESFGIVLVEAMASGLPVVVGRRSGAAATIVGEGGIAVDVVDPTSIADAVSSLLLDSRTAASVAVRGGAIARSYAIGAVVGRYLELLSKAGAGDPRRQVRRARK